MSILTGIVNSIVDELPKFNDDLILKKREYELDGLKDFITQCYVEFLEAVGLDIEMREPYVVSPTERLQYELEHTGYGSKKTKLKVHMHEAELMCFEFVWDGQILKKYLYLPYIYEDNYLKIGGVRYDLMANLTEKVFTVKYNSITMKVMRIILWFKRDFIHQFVSESSGKEFSATMIISKIFNKKVSKTKKALKPTIVLYMLTRFGLVGLLNMLGYKGDEVQYVGDIDDPDNYEYVKIQNISMKHNPAMVKFKKSHAKDKHIIDIVAALSYTLGSFRNINLDHFLQDDRSELLIYLGKCILGRDSPKEKAHSTMQLHIASTENYLDSYYRRRLQMSGIVVENFYELLMYIWFNFHEMLGSHKPNDMFGKSIDFINTMVIDTYVRKLYRLFYEKKMKNNQRMMMKYVRDILGITMSAEFILKTLRGSAYSGNVKANPAIYSDNWLTTIGCKGIKSLGGNSKQTNPMSLPSNRYHPSMLMVESAVGFSSSNPSKNFVINPHAVIDSEGGFIKTKLAKKVEKEMIRYLPG